MKLTIAAAGSLVGKTMMPAPSVEYGIVTRQRRIEVQRQVEELRIALAVGEHVGIAGERVELPGDHTRVG